MAAKKIQPTNSDIIREIQKMNSRLGVLESWKERIEIGKAAIDEYKKEEKINRDSNQRREIFKQTGIVLALIAAVLYVYLESHGVHP